MLTQEAWKTKEGWDSQLPLEIQTAWKDVADEQALVKQITFLRQVVKEGVAVTLQVFTDASARAYGTCAYFVTQQQSHLITPKAKVAPINKITIPQMELTALLTSTSLAMHIKQTMLNVNITDEFMWCDNESYKRPEVLVL
ncbi:uncharacterized protein [Procambarus clarkii]|uniref:uncharacterized protein n=1 Tax=Procambarus clarkii TaxID=6728 RepID=UPI001E673530|nr:uncharacterized protein LOC123760779 [Procambarus clarkii]